MMDVFKAQRERRWRACAFVRFSLPIKFPELHPPGARHCSALGTEYMTHCEACDKLWNMRSCVDSLAWMFWIEPENMTAKEREFYRPEAARKEIAV